MINKGILRSLYKQYGMFAFAVIAAVILLVVSDSTFLKYKTRISQDDIGMVSEIYEKKIKPILNDKNNYDEYGELIWKDEYDNLEYSGKDGMTYIFDLYSELLAVVPPEEAYNDISANVTFETYEAYNYDLEKLNEAGELFVGREDLAMVINNTLFSPESVLLCILIIYIFIDLRKSSNKYLYGCIPVNRKQMIMSVYVFVQSILLVSTIAGSILFIIQCYGGIEKIGEVIMALAGCYLLVLMITTFLIMLLTMLIHPMVVFVLVICGYALADIASGIISVSLYRMFDIEIPDLTTVTNNFTAILASPYLRYKGFMSLKDYYNQYAVYAGICIALTVIMCVFSVVIYRKNNMAKNKGVWIYKMSKTAVYIKNIVIGTVISMAAGIAAINISEGFKYIDKYDLFGYSQISYQYENGNGICTMYFGESSGTYVMLGIIVILAGIALGVAYTVFRRRKSGGVKYAQ